MANNKKISELNQMSASIFAAADIFPVVDMSALETMYITKASLFLTQVQLEVTQPVLLIFQF
jgi:hypothetical protein